MLSLPALFYEPPGAAKASVMEEALTANLSVAGFHATATTLATGSPYLPAVESLLR